MMKLNHFAAGFLLVCNSLVFAADPELRLLSEHPVNGMKGGNLSGLAQCGQTLWTVSDRDDNQIYRLDTRATVWQAETVPITVPPVPDDSGRSLFMKMRSALASLVRGASLDYEGISCDGAGNRYIVSETYSAVLKVTPQGEASWLAINPLMVNSARAKGMLLHANALFEGLAVDPDGGWIRLVAERERRGMVVIGRSPDNEWICPFYLCVMFSEDGLELQPPQFPNPQWVARDFSDLALHQRKLFTLDRNAFKICRHRLVTGTLERCWSFAAEALVPHRQYPSRHGMVEALLVDEKGAWIGVDNNSVTRADGESRPIVWRFAAPEGGWDAEP